MSHEIKIDADGKCKTCGVAGTLEDEYCIKHSPTAKLTMESYTAKILELYASGYIHIGPKIAAQIIGDVQGLLVEHLHQMDVAYTASDDGLSITFGVKLSLPKVHEGEGVKVDTSMTFVESKVKDSRSGVINEKQKDLFKE